MNDIEKKLLFADICARIPYGLKIKSNESGIVTTIKRGGTFDDGNDYFITQYIGCALKVDEFMPYLRPMSSMTAEERKEYKDMNVLDNCDEFSNIEKNIEDIKKNGEENYIQLPRTHAQDYLNSIHVDYRGLIERGLALPAPEGMYEVN